MKGHIQKRGKNSWRLKFDAGLNPLTGDRKIQYKTFRGTKREAQLKMAELITAVGGGRYVEPTKVTVDAYVRSRINLWEQNGHISARTAERYRYLADGQIGLHVGPMLIQQLKPLDVESWHSALLAKGHSSRKKGVSIRTVKHAHRVLSKALSDALRDELVSRNVCAIQVPPKVPDDEMVIVRDVPALIESLLRWRHSTIGMIALFTGARLGEVLALKWGRVDLGHATVSIQEALENTKAHGVRFKAPKTRAGRRHVSLPDVLLSALVAFRRQRSEERLRMGLGKLPDDALLFADIDGRPLSTNALSSAWSHFAASAGIPGVSFHALRHTHVSQLIDQGVDVVTISRRLGHANPAITLRIYAHLFQKDDVKASEAINRAMRPAN
jgi:integrase